MASTFIRVFAIMLALTGFSATSYNGASSGSGANAQVQEDGGPTTSSPNPVCPINDPNYCGLR